MSQSTTLSAKAKEMEQFLQKYENAAPDTCLLLLSKRLYELCNFDEFLTTTDIKNTIFDWLYNRTIKFMALKIGTKISTIVDRIKSVFPDETENVVEEFMTMTVADLQRIRSKQPLYERLGFDVSEVTKKQARKRKTIQAVLDSDSDSDSDSDKERDDSSDGSIGPDDNDPEPINEDANNKNIVIESNETFNAMSRDRKIDWIVEALWEFRRSQYKMAHVYYARVVDYAYKRPIVIKLLKDYLDKHAFVNEGENSAGIWQSIKAEAQKSEEYHSHVEFIEKCYSDKNIFDLLYEENQKRSRMQNFQYKPSKKKRRSNQVL